METNFYRQALIRNFLSIVALSDDVKAQVKVQLSVDKNMERICGLSREELTKYLEEVEFIIGKIDRKEEIINAILDECNSFNG
ncbi:hypothetical protein D1867_11305 [Acidianus infernus]|uniref:Uncharacterized protein n=1 Tax=Acidianus infernus TaxID=12915 RepID=A0A6A9QGB7_ACIIN|nr:hypothetical protein [Acidianus infernus]MUM65809.1 hypothetical protein [Acidianus infernus]